MPKKMLETKADANSHPIDAVLAWVDGSDPEFLKRMEPFLEKKKRSAIPGAHPTRFASINEIRYSVLSILTFAPFVRKIFVITAGQDPKLHENINKYFPERVEDVRIVDHSEIFRGFEQFLPTFSSRSIESMMWRINGLADKFIYFNDDIFLIRKTSPSDWFVSERPILRGRWLKKPTIRILWDKIKLAIFKDALQNANYQPRPSYHLAQWLAANELGFKNRYFFFSHTPFALNRSVIEAFFYKNQTLLKKNIAYRFKFHTQFNFVALVHHIELLAGNNFFASPDLAYVQPYNRPHNYIDKKISFCEQNDQIKFLCVQSLEMCSKEVQQKMFSWLDKTLGLKP